MDADFVQSVARVGDLVEVRLAAGEPFVGVLAELTLNRLVLQEDGGARAALALSSILSLRTVPRPSAPVSAPAPLPAPPPPEPVAVPEPATAVPGPATAVPALISVPALFSVPPAAATAPLTAVQVPVPVTAAQAPVPLTAAQAPVPLTAAHAPVPETVDGLLAEVVAAEPQPPTSAVPLTEALRTAATLPLDVSFEVAIQTDYRGELHAARQRYDNAVKQHELAPKFGRISMVAAGLRRILVADPANGDLHHVLGVIELLAGNPTEARQLFATAADLTADPDSWRALAVAAAALADHKTVTYGLLRFFRVINPAIDPAAWQALLDVLDATGDRSPLGDLLTSFTLTPTVRRVVEEAWPGATPLTGGYPRPAGAQPRPIRQRAGGPAPGPAAPAVRPTAGAVARTASTPAPQAEAKHRRDGDYFARADELNKKKRDFKGAMAAYTEEIRTNGPKRESAVKDLAWLTKRLYGAAAALRVIEEQFPGVVPPGDSLDNILIDFYIAAGRFGDALTTLNRQLATRDRTSSKGRHLLHQIAFVRYSAGQDSIPEWRELLEDTPANPAVRRGLALAYVQQGTPSALDEAESLIRDDTTDRADDIRKQITAVRMGDESPPLGPARFIDRLFTSALVAYVMDRYSEQAAAIKDQRKREKKQPSFPDARRLADNAGHSRGYQREISADSYISAAAILREYGASEGHDEDEDELHDWLCSGLTALADLALDRQANEAARDLYCEALAASERLRNPGKGGDARLAIGRFFLSLDGRPALSFRRNSALENAPLDGVAAPILRKLHEQHGNAIFPLVAQLVAQTDVAAEAVTAAIHRDNDLRSAAAQYLQRRGLIVEAQPPSWDADPDDDDEPAVRPALEVMRDAWQRYGSEWTREQRRRIAVLASLHELTVTEEVLRSALANISEVRPEADSDQESLTQVEDALRQLLQFIYAESFEERDACLRRVIDAMNFVRSEVAKAPTSFAVEGIDPIAVRMTALVEEAQRALIRERRPQPELALALDQSNRDQHGLVTVQIEIGNKDGMAPLESAELHVGTGSELFSPQDEVLRLPSAVSGGGHRVLMVKLHVSDAGVRAGAFSLPVTLRYRARGDEDYDKVEANLPVQLADPSEFEEIHNPFFQGSTGAPVQDPDMFYGREDLLDSIERRLRNATAPGTGVAIFGQKRAGKSSIRLRLIDRLSAPHESQNLVVVDLGNIGSFGAQDARDEQGNRLLAGLLWEILTKTTKQLRADPRTAGRPSLTAGVSRNELAASLQPVVDFINVIEDYFEGMADPPQIVVLIDEFQYFDEWIRNGLLPASFMQALKALIERRIFHLVIVGQDALERVIRQHANVFVVFARERVTYLDETNARKLIDEPIRIGGRSGPSRYRQHAIDRIVELTGGSAFYIQKFCYELVEQMNLNRAPLVTEADVELVREHLLEQLGAEDFDNLETAGYTEIDAPRAEQYRAVLLAVAIASRDGLATFERVRAVYRNGGDLASLLDDLVIRDVVRKEAAVYRIVVRLYQDWLLMHDAGVSGMAPR